MVWWSGQEFVLEFLARFYKLGEGYNNTPCAINTGGIVMPAVSF